MYNMIITGIYNHLQLMSKTSKSKLFLSVNKELVNRIEYKVKVGMLCYVL